MRQVGKMLGVVGATQGALIQAAVVGEEPSRIDAGEDVNMAVGENTSLKTLTFRFYLDLLKAVSKEAVMKKNNNNK